MSAAMPPASGAAVGEAAPDALAPKLSGVQVGLRKDLQVARHLFRGNVTYTIRDPISFETHAFSAADYAVLVALTGDRTLGESFHELLKDSVVEAKHEETFYRFVLSLHRAGMLALPMSDDKNLIHRYESRAASRRNAKWMALLYYRIPVWNPDAFLKRTLGFGLLAFSRPAFVVWSLLMIAAAVALVSRAASLGSELPGLVAGEQALSMWFLLIALKIFHEFGHAYACRSLGGVVTEMGVSLVLMTPCAYVDASSSWNFTRTWDRLKVCFGGVYFESWISGVAALAWAFTEPSPLHTIAYQTMLLASVTTIGFNINPLMRYDGYFILSDMLQVPNLRSQSTALIVRWLKRLTVGIDPGGPTWSLRMGATLILYGIASAMYRVTASLGMCAVIAVKFFVIGMALGLAYGGMTLIKTLYKCAHYLLLDKETAGVRRRAAVVAAALLVLPAVAVSIPLPRHVLSLALVQRQRESILTASVGGLLDYVPASATTAVTQGETMVLLTSIDVEGQLESAEAQLQAAQLAADGAAAGAPGEQALAAEELHLAQQRVQRARLAAEDLVTRAPFQGSIADVIQVAQRGRFVPAGTPLATVVSGGWNATALVDQVDLARLRARPGDEVELRVAGDSGTLLNGWIESIAPAGDASIDKEFSALTLLGGGDIAVVPTTGRAMNAHFAVRVAISTPASATLRRGEIVVLRLPAQRVSLAQGWYRSILRFRERLAAAE